MALTSYVSLHVGAPVQAAEGVGWRWDPLFSFLFSGNLVQPNPRSFSSLLDVSLKTAQP